MSRRPPTITSSRPAERAKRGRSRRTGRGSNDAGADAGNSLRNRESTRLHDGNFAEDMIEEEAPVAVSASRVPIRLRWPERDEPLDASPIDHRRELETAGNCHQIDAFA